jgi:hypothetical protein
MMNIDYIKIIINGIRDLTEETEAENLKDNYEVKQR